MTFVMLSIELFLAVSCRTRSIVARTSGLSSRLIGIAILSMSDWTRGPMLRRSELLLTVEADHALQPLHRWF